MLIIFSLLHKRTGSICIAISHNRYIPLLKFAWCKLESTVLLHARAHTRSHSHTYTHTHTHITHTLTHTHTHTHTHTNTHHKHIHTHIHIHISHVYAFTGMNPLVLHLMLSGVYCKATILDLAMGLQYTVLRSVCFISDLIGP